MSLSLKVRVMPRCWYVLMRFWLRVDGVLIRLRETRFFCKMTPGAGAEPVLPPGLPEEKRAALLASLAAGPAASSRLPPSITSPTPSVHFAGSDPLYGAT
jgi:hypothetical protein